MLPKWGCCPWFLPHSRGHCGALTRSVQRSRAGGTLPDMSCHTIDLVYWALRLTAPTTVVCTGGRYALVTMCIGGGQGIAAIFEAL